MSALAGLCCACGSSAILAIRPGIEPLRRGAVDIVTRRDPLIDPGAPDAAWCAGCWRAKWAALRPAQSRVTLDGRSIGVREDHEKRRPKGDQTPAAKRQVIEIIG